MRVLKCQKLEGINWMMTVFKPRLYIISPKNYTDMKEDSEKGVSTTKSEIVDFI